MHSSVGWLHSLVFKVWKSPRQVIKKDHVSVEALKAIEHNNLGKTSEEFQAHKVWTGKRKALCPPLRGALAEGEGI